MTNMKNIISKLQHNSESKGKRWVDTKEGWLAYEHDIDKEKLMEIVCGVLRSENIEIISDVVPIEKLRKKYNFTIKRQNKKISAGRPEETLERFIVASNTNIHNQYNVSSENKKESIDLVIVDGENWKLIELKPWESNNSPIYGVIELLKNYCLLAEKGNKVEELVLLAPKKYYESYWKEKSCKGFMETVDKIVKQIEGKVGIKIAYLDFDQKTFDDAIEKLANLSNSNWEPPKRHRGYQDSKKVIIEPNMQVLECVKDKLEFSKWKYIRSCEEWPKE